MPGGGLNSEWWVFGTRTMHASSTCIECFMKRMYVPLCGITRWRKRVQCLFVFWYFFTGSFKDWDVLWMVYIQVAIITRVCTWCDHKWTGAEALCGSSNTGLVVLKTTWVIGLGAHTSFAFKNYFPKIQLISSHLRLWHPRGHFFPS